MWKSDRKSRESAGKVDKIVGTESNPTKMKSGQIIINKKATKQNIDKLIEINEDGLGKKQSGKTTTDGTDGGLLKGKPHYDENGNPTGGIPVVVDNSRNIEVEGEEFVVNAEASKEHWQELSKINQSTGNGVAIGPPNGAADDDPEEYDKGGKIQFNANHVPNKWILAFAEKVRTQYPKVWDLGGNIFGNEAYKNLKRVAERGYWLDSEEWMYIKWQSYVARHKKDFRIAGVIAMLKWVDKVDRGWAYMKQIIEEKINKEKSGWKHKTTKMKTGGPIEMGSKKFMQWYIDWYKAISDSMNITFSLPNELLPFKENNVVILDLFEKKKQDIDAKKYLHEIVKKANDLGVVIYLEPKPSHKYFFKNEAKKKKITKEYLIDYYRNFGFEITQNKKFMKRLPKMSGGGDLIKRADGTYSQRGLWDNIRANIGSGKKPTKQMLEQEEKIKRESKYHLGGDMSKHLAPNGKPSNLTHDQWHLVRTPEFISWFGDWENSPETASKVVDENGEPLVVYHGTNNQFNVFDKELIKNTNWGEGFYFTEDEIDKGAYKYVMEVFLSIKNPFIVNKKAPFIEIILGKQKYDTQLGDLIQQELEREIKASNKLKKNGYDGVKVSYKKMIVVFNSNQIKIADGTNITFDSENSDIRFSDGGGVNENFTPIFQWKMMGIEQEDGTIKNVPYNEFYLWIYDDAKAEQKLKDGVYEYPYPTIEFNDDLESIWSKNKFKRYKGNKHIVGFVYGHVDQYFLKEGYYGMEIYVMTTKPSFRRQGVNEFAIRYLRNKFNLDKEKVEFTMPTEQGKLFIASNKYSGGGSTDEVDKIKLEIIKLNTKAFKMMPGSPRQKDTIKQIDELRAQLEAMGGKFEDGGSADAPDTVTFDIPLLIRTLELAREDIKSDANLHRMVENLIQLKNKKVLTMDDYDYIANIKKHTEKMKEGGTTQAQRNKIAEVMQEFKEGELHSGSARGPIVTDRDQAIAIALSEANASKYAPGGGVGSISDNDIIKFIADNSYFDYDNETDPLIFSTRQNGDVGNERPGKEDIAEGQRIKSLLLKKFNGLEVDIEIVDEFVMLMVEIQNQKPAEEPKEDFDLYAPLEFEFGEESFDEATTSGKALILALKKYNNIKILNYVSDSMPNELWITNDKLKVSYTFVGEDGFEMRLYRTDWSDNVFGKLDKTWGFPPIPAYENAKLRSYVAIAMDIIQFLDQQTELVQKLKEPEKPKVEKSVDGETKNASNSDISDLKAFQKLNQRKKNLPWFTTDRYKYEKLLLNSLAGNKYIYDELEFYKKHGGKDLLIEFGKADWTKTYFIVDIICVNCYDSFLNLTQEFQFKRGKPVSRKNNIVFSLRTAEWSVGRNNDIEYTIDELIEVANYTKPEKPKVEKIKVDIELISGLELLLSMSSGADKKQIENLISELKSKGGKKYDLGGEVEFDGQAPLSQEEMDRRIMENQFGNI